MTPTLYTAADAAEILRVKQSWLERQAAARYDTKLWMRDLKEGAAYLPK
jgi:hypothetical protein